MFLIVAFIVICAVGVGLYEDRMYARRDKNEQEAAQALLDDLHSPRS